MLELPNSDPKDPSEAQNQDVLVQEIPPFMGMPVDVATVSATAMHLSSTDKMTLIGTLYNSLDKSLIVELQHSPYMQLRFHQARTSFRIAVSSVTFSLTSCAVYAGLLVTGTLPPSFTVASGIVTSTSGAVSLYCYRLYKDANNRLDYAQSTYRVSKPPISPDYKMDFRGSHRPKNHMK